MKPADINGDGKVDLVYTNDDFSTVAVLFGNGDGTFGTPSEYPAGEDTFGLALARCQRRRSCRCRRRATSMRGQVTVLLNANGSGVQSSFTLGATTPPQL